MTAFCCGCHGKFHEKEDDSSGNWIRHPVDSKIPIASGFEDYTIYDPLIPVGRPVLSGWIGPSPVVNEGGTEKKDMVICLSCHRVHGSPYPDILRWDYDTMVSGKGCFTCHTSKDTG
jgi:predicted CXXCH cytochrome family protein